jgi:DNA-binding response OmpR family regulator
LDKLKVIKSLNILYAEDDKDTREKTTNILKLMFNDVLIATNGIQAIEVFKKNRIDLVLLDYVMPITDGFEVAQFIRNSNKTIPIIISSAYTNKEKLLKIIELNYIQYIEKPIIFEDLNQAINKSVNILIENNKITICITDDICYNYTKQNIIKRVNNKDSKELKLSKNEIKLVELLLSKRGQLFTKEMIEDDIFKKLVQENTIRNLVYRLRKKVESDFILTIKDLGYMIQ